MQFAVVVDNLITEIIVLPHFLYQNWSTIFLFTAKHHCPSLYYVVKRSLLSLLVYIKPKLISPNLYFFHNVTEILFPLLLVNQSEEWQFEEKGLFFCLNLSTMIALKQMHECTHIFHHCRPYLYIFMDFNNRGSSKTK